LAGGVLADREIVAFKRLARRAAPIAFATIAGLIALIPGAFAQDGGRWLLVVPPQIAEKRAMLGVYAASSAADVRSAVGSLPHAEQAQLVVKVYKILAIPTAAERTEALLEALQDPTAPLFRWRRVDAFESAASCERQRELALQGFELEASRVRSAYPGDEELSREDWRLFEGWSACRKSRCVPESALAAR